MAIRLFNQYGASNDVGNEISDKVATLVNTLVEEYPDYDLNDMSLIITDTVGAEMAVARIIFATKMRKAERTQ